MELTLTVHLPRRRPDPVDVVVRWSGEHQAAALVRALGSALGVPVTSLMARGRPVPGTALVGRPPLVHGAAVTAVEDGAAPVAGPRGGETVGSPVLELAVVGGPDAGRSITLSPPGALVGRSVPNGLSLADEALSRVHATLDVDSSGVVLRDEGSTNGVLVDGLRVRGPTSVDASATVVLGSSTLRVRRLGGAGGHLRARGDGRLVLRTAPARVPVPDDAVVTAPTPPAEPVRARVPWLAALLPVPVAVVLAAFLGPQVLAFALLGPVLMLGTAVGDRVGSGRSYRRASADHEVAMRAAERAAAHLLADEVARLDRAHPDPHTVLRTVEGRLPGLWARSHLRVRLGHGDTPTRVVVKEGTQAARPLARHAPVVLDLAEAGGLSVCGPAELVDRVLAGLAGQLLVGCPPSVLRVAVSPNCTGWDWIARTPHAVPPPSGNASDEVRATGAPGGGRPDPARVLVVPATAGAAASDVLAAAAAGWVVLVGQRDDAPLTASPVLRLRAPSRLISARATNTVVPDQVGRWWTDRVSRALAPLQEDLTEDAAGLPARVTLDELAGGVGSPDASDVARRWAASDGLPRATVGMRAGGPYVIDLVTDGPHVLVGGTTGSGKSEFLRSLVLSLALGSPPEDLALVLVDFKGGAAFGPLAALPHVAGVLTDLDEHLVDRALSSLRAELRRRERLFAEMGVHDLASYRARPGRREPLPRLVVVVDELKALVDEVPRFLDGLVRLAALGRSLGVHLVLASQRPTGALSTEVRANINLRIAFRVRDRTDSVDVLEDPAAALIDPGVPGRALARGGDGVLVPFQAAVIGRRRAEAAPFLSVSLLQLDAPGPGTTPEKEPQSTRSTTPGSPGDPLTDAVVLMTEAAVLAGQIGVRRPWLMPLPDRVPPLVNGDAGSEVVAGLVDEPDHQQVSLLACGPDTGTWLVSGPPRSGRSTAARALVLTAVAGCPPTEVHVHVVDPTSALGDLAALPHVGTVVAPGDRRGLAALVDHLEHLARQQREPRDRGGGPVSGSRRSPAPRETLVVVDGWDQLAEASDAAWFDPVLERLLALLRDGGATGIRGVVTGGRTLLQPRWTGLGGTVLLLGRVDPLEAALTGLRATDLPTNPPPGRGVRVRDRREVQVAAADDGTTAIVAGRWVAEALPSAARPWRYRPLPAVVARPRRAPVRDVISGSLSVQVGLVATSAGPQPWSWTPHVQGRTLLVAGPARSGRSATLTTIAESLLDGGSGHHVLFVTRANGALRHHRLTVVAPEDVALVIETRRRCPSVAVLVDDADRLEADAPLRPVLREMTDLLDRDAGLLVVASTTSSTATRFRGIEVEAARSGPALLLTPQPSDGEAVGRGRLPDVPSIPGRGLLLGVDPVPVELQVYLPDGSGPVGVVGSQAVDALGGQGDPGGDERHGNEPPPEELEAALDHPAAHGEEQRAPHDRRGLGPRGVAQPSLGHHPETHPEDGDQEGRHEDTDGVAALTDRELVDVEDGEPEQRDGLQPGQGGGGAAGAA